MVYILDEGGVFDASIEKIWKYLQSELHVHPSRNLINREAPEKNVAVLTSERNFAGSRVKSKIRITMFPPFGMVQEHLEGPTAGSKAFQFYIPRGDKTGVTVVGEYVSKGMDDNVLRKAIMESLEEAFNEDNANLKKMK